MIELRVGTGSCGLAAGAGETLAALKAEIAGRKLDIAIREVGCLGVCYLEPLVEVIRPDRTTLYAGMDAKKAARIVAEDLVGGNPVTEFLAANAADVIGRQERIVLRHSGIIDPGSLDAYLAAGGYAGLTKALTLTPDAVIREVETSGLRGRGGAGFPTGRKWRLVREQPGAVKYLICNADEGDPGAFMDRAVCESDPFSVLEGMAIAAHAIGAGIGYIYCRAEYPLALKRLRAAIAAAEAAGYLGKNILQSGLNLFLHIKEGAGAFVCGEETALIGSIEGRRGMPRLRPPYPAAAGVFGKPTNINNVETYANLPWILERGGAAYAAFGYGKSRGTKVFALAGKIAHGGLVEVPMGMTLRQVIFDIGGGIPDGKQFKAVQLGGPSGGCLPAALLETPVDYESLMASGAIVGSGGMVVMDETSCMVDIARFFLSFTQKESCGKCTFCRVGTTRMLEILERITAGKGEAADLERLDQLGTQIKQASLCGLGQSAPNPVLTTLRYFRDEYEAHIKDKRCPARVCRPLLTFWIDAKACIGCTLCAKSCPVNAITGEPKKTHILDQQLCIKCGACYSVCPVSAVVKE